MPVLPTINTMKKILYFATFISLLSIVSCYYDTEAELYGVVPCDNSTLTYTARISPLMTAKCLSCHDAASGSAVVLENYTQVKDQFTNGKALCAVERGNGCLAMPQSAPLSSCDLEACQKWVEAGCPE
jgi:hypothetical protein